MAPDPLAQHHRDLRCRQLLTKIKRVLFCDDKRTVIIGGDFNYLIVWDSETINSEAENSSEMKTISLGASSSTVLDMTWAREYRCSSVRLLVLSSIGEHILFSISHNVATNQIDMKEVEDLRTPAHATNGSEPFKQGSITSFEATVASTIGYEVVIRTNGHKNTKLSATVFNQHKALLSDSRVTHLHLLSTTRLLAFILQESKIVEFDIDAEAIIRQVIVSDRPVTVAVSTEIGTILLHDPEGVMRAYSLDNLQEVEIGDHAMASVAGLPFPVSFVPGSPLAILGATDKIFVFNTASLLRRDIHAAARRIYALDACIPLKEPTSVRIVAATMPEDEWDKKARKWISHGWVIQLFHLQDIHQSDLSLGQFPGTLQPDPTPAPSPADHGPSASPPLRSNNLQGPSAQPNKRKTSADSTSLKKQKLTGPGDSAQVWICQDGACLEYTFWGSEGYCMACAGKGSGNPNNIREECRFIHFRWWKLDVDDTYVIHFNDDSECFKDDGEKRFEYFAWTPRGIGSTNMIRSATAKALLPKLKAELQHVNSALLHFRAFPKAIKYICDNCHMSLLFQSWFCPGCGLELCGSCYMMCPEIDADFSLPCTGPHCKTWFRPVSVFSAAELQDAISRMEGALASPLHEFLRQVPYFPPIVAESQRHVEGVDMLEMKRYKVGDLTDQQFMGLWRRREPFVLVGVIDPATPEELFDLKKHKGKKCKITYYEGGVWCTEESTLGNYFKSWGKKQSRSLQIRDYPPTSDLKTVHPELYDRFTNCVKGMFEEHMAPRGPLNLFSYFPKGSLLPDLGPKLYISQADQLHCGTTFAHMDKAGAVNVMLHSQPGSGDQRSGARWEIWGPRNIHSLSKALESSASDESCKMAQPIISETYYISPEVSRNAFRNSGLAGWFVNQLPGEAVIIPPGCPHQVSNQSHCIKAAVDFALPTDIAELEMLRNNFRTMNIAENRMIHDDLLQLDVMLWYAWQSTL